MKLITIEQLEANRIFGSDKIKDLLPGGYIYDVAETLFSKYKSETVEYDGVQKIFKNDCLLETKYTIFVEHFELPPQAVPFPKTLQEFELINSSTCGSVYVLEENQGDTKNELFLVA